MGAARQETTDTSPENVTIWPPSRTNFARHTRIGRRTRQGYSDAPTPETLRNQAAELPVLVSRGERRRGLNVLEPHYVASNHLAEDLLHLIEGERSERLGPDFAA